MHDLLALLHTGGRDLRTVRLSATTRTDHEVVSRARERWLRERGQSVVHSLAERPAFSEERTRLWIERPDKVREEVDGQFPHYGVSVGDTWWMSNGVQGAMTNNGSPNHTASIGEHFRLMLEPAPLLPRFDFEILGEKSTLGRRVVHVHAHTRPTNERHVRLLPPMAIGGEDCEFEIEVEHGTLLRLVALIEGQPAIDRRITEIAYNEPIDPERFVFVPREGEEIEDVSTGRDFKNESIEEIARRAKFSVFKATGLDAGWRMRAIHLRPRRGDSWHEQVHLHYNLDDATRSFSVNEQSSRDPIMYVTDREPDEIERNGESVYVIAPTDAFPLGSIRLFRAGTSIEITSDNLTVDQLLEIADRLESTGGPQ
ncbi:MAG TPA: hypothetical protein VGQ38_01620 [Gaiellaceae bacterium]|nr:hypothetical protein [Gaiellaceae bacterium]